MGLGVMAIAGGGLGGYVAYVKQNTPPVVQDTAIPAAETIANAAETAARVVVGGPGSGEGSPVAAAGLAALSPGDGSMPTAPESGTTPTPTHIQYNLTHVTRTEGIDPHMVITVERVAGGSVPASEPINFSIRADDSTSVRYDFTLNPGDPGYVVTGDQPECYFPMDKDLAAEGTDYRGGVYNGVIAGGQSFGSINIPIIDDDIGEAPESFCILLSTSDEGVEVTQANGSHGRVVASLNDNDNIVPTYQNSYLKLGEPGWNHRTADLVLHFERGMSYDTVMRCQSENGKIAPFQFTVPASDQPQTFRTTISPVKDGDFLYDWDKLTCGLVHSPVMVDTKYLQPGLPVWIQDSDVPNGMARTDGEGNSVNAFMIVGDLGCAGIPQDARIIINRPAPSGGLTFNIDTTSAGVTVPETATIPQGAHDIAFRVGIPREGAVAPYTTYYVTVSHPSGWYLANGVPVNQAVFRSVPYPCQSEPYIPKPMPVVPTRPANAALELSWAEGTKGVNSDGELNIVEGTPEAQVMIVAKLNHDAVFDEYLELKDRTVTACRDGATDRDSGCATGVNDYSLRMNGKVFISEGERNATATFYVKALPDGSDESPEHFKIRLENDGLKSNELTFKVLDPDDAPVPTPTPTPKPDTTGPPGPVAYVGVYASPTDREVIATWPASTTGGPAQVYNVCLSPQDADLRNCAPVGANATLMHTFANVSPGLYWVTVTAKNSHGESAAVREGIELKPPPAQN